MVFKCSWNVNGSSLPNGHLSNMASTYRSHSVSFSRASDNTFLLKYVIGWQLLELLLLPVCKIYIYIYVTVEEICLEVYPEVHTFVRGTPNGVGQTFHPHLMDVSWINSQRYIFILFVHDL